MTEMSPEQLERVRYLASDDWVSDTDSPDDDRISWERFTTVLRQMGPLELHQFALAFNWDCGVAELVEVIRHPACDAGTALLVFWLGQPGWHYKYEEVGAVPAHEREIFELLKEIEAKYVSHGFATSTIGVDPSNICGQNFVDGSAAARSRIPDVMFIPSPGEALAPLQL